MGRRDQHGKRGGAGRGAEIPPLEWATALAGAVLLAGALAFMVREALVPDEPGPVELVVTQVRPLDAGFLVEFEARNGGGATYAELEIQGTLRAGGGREERARMTLDYLPGRSSRGGGFFFRSDPGAGELDLEVKSFRKP